DRRPKPVLLQVHKRASELDQPLVEQIVRAAPARQPELLQHVMRLVEKLLVEAMKVAGVMRVKQATLALGDQGGDLRAFLAHAGSLRGAGGFVERTETNRGWPFPQGNRCDRPVCGSK